MIPLTCKEMHVNRFVDVALPTKRMIFSRLGASAPGTHFSGDDPVHFGMMPTEKADAIISAAEGYNPPVESGKEESNDSE